MDPSSTVTALLLARRAGQPDALDRLMPLVYEHMRELAHQRLAREAPGHTLDTTALVHEAYIRLVDQTRVQWVDRAHFFAVAAQAMRRVLVDHARRCHAMKRGGRPQRVELADSHLIANERAEHLLALDAALERMALVDERLSRMVEYRFFGGLTEEETASALGVHVRTVRRDWIKAKGWLHSELM